MDENVEKCPLCTLIDKKVALSTCEAINENGQDFMASALITGK